MNHFFSTSRAKETALHYAVQVGSTDIIQQLLDAGANINAINNIGESALTIAIQERKLTIVKYLVSSGCKLFSGDYLSPLCLACRQNSQDIIGFLLSEGYNVSGDQSLRRYIFLQLEESNPVLFAYIYFRCENPMTLKETCRVVLRKHLNQPINETVFQLAMPRILQDWTAEDNIYKWNIFSESCIFLLVLVIKEKYFNPCHAEWIKMPCPFVIFSQLDYLIQVVHTNSNT